MKLIQFAEQNTVFAKNQPEYIPLPAHMFKDDCQGRMACKWKLSFWERIVILFTGVVWQQVLTFKSPLQPQLLTIKKPNMEPVNQK